MFLKVIALVLQDLFGSNIHAFGLANMELQISITSTSHK
jgi:hypothetical protein